MNILVTGVSRGIGKEIVKNFVTNGIHTIVAISRNEAKLMTLVNECYSINQKSKVIPLTYDLSTHNFEDLYNLITYNINELNILINNAGYLKHQPFEEFSEKEAHKIFDTNFFAPAKLIKTLLPLLKNSSNAHIVNISSMGGFQGSVKFEGLSYYSASKAALSNLTECLAVEFSNYNIAVNCLALGSVQTEMLEEAFPGFKASIQPSGIAEYIASFALSGNKYYNGKIIPVSNTTP